MTGSLRAPRRAAAHEVPLCDLLASGSAGGCRQRRCRRASLECVGTVDLSESKILNEIANK